MFWGLILKANKKYTQTLEKPFHLTMASLDYSNADSEPVQVMYSDGKSTFLLCTLQKDKDLQCSLDLAFNEGDTLCFSTKGNGIVHLSGYLIPEEDLNYDPMEEDDSDIDISDDADEEVPDLREKLSKKKKEKEKASKKAPVEEESDEESNDEDIPNGNQSLDSSAVAEDSDEDAEDEEESEDDDEEESLDGLESDEEEDSAEEEEEEVKMPPKKQPKLDPELAKKQKNGLENGQQQKKDKKDKNSQKEQPQAKKENKPQQNDNSIKKLQGGLAYQDLKVGGGAEAKPGKKIQVYYEGRVKGNNKTFDSTKSGPGFKLTVGRGEVIKGWDLGLVGMKVGGKRRITCPPGLAYGSKGNPPVIPPNSTLVFDVELKNVL